MLRNGLDIYLIVKISCQMKIGHNKKVTITESINRINDAHLLIDKNICDNIRIFKNNLILNNKYKFCFIDDM